MSETHQWVIAGGESGPDARPAHPDWFRSARDQCQAAGVPFFFKQWGGNRPAFNEPVPPRTILVNPDGTLGRYSEGTLLDGYHAMVPVSRKAAGALLDGREWREFPSVHVSTGGKIEY